MGIIFSSFNGLEPRLRFPSFDNKWTLTTIGNVCAFTNGKAHEQNVVEYGEYIIVNSKFISSDGVVKKYSNKQICPLFKNDIVMVMSDVPNGKAMSKCFCIDKDNKYTLNQRICALRTKQIPLYYMMQINRNDYFMKFDDGVKQTNLRKDDVLACPVYSTTIKEQTKIADFLSLIDQRIEKQRRLVESLKKYKRGLFLKLYNDSEKKGYKICDLGKYCATGALSKDDIDASGKYPCILYGELFTKYGEVIKQVASRTNIIPTYLSGTNEILFPSSTTADAQSLIFPSSLKIKNIFLGGDLFTIKLKNEFDSDFISYLVNFKYKNTLARYAQGITIIHLHYTDIKEQVIDIPNVNTQFNISSVMRKIETIIEMNSNELNSLLLMKKGFLQKMFI